MSPLLTRALMKVCPFYFSMSKKEQLKYRLTMPMDEMDAVIIYLEEKLYGVKISSPIELEQLFFEQTNEEITKLNTLLMPLVGIGEDLFFLNENFANDVDITHFETLYDYDYDDYKFQAGLITYGGDSPERPYQGTLGFCWARLLIDDHFTYASLNMEGIYIIHEVDEFSQHYIKQLVPHKIYRGENDGKKDGEYYILDLKTNANGKESVLDELEKRARSYLVKTRHEILDTGDRENQNGVYIINKSTPGYPMHYFIFTDKNVLKKIRFKTFMKDCRSKIMQDNESLYKKIDVEKEKIKDFLDAQYKDIISS